jgi:V/A-type H+-transporting ATPase subunit D
MTTRLAATRSELLRSRRRLERVERGIDLLTRKRRALAAELFRVATPAIEARTRVCAAAARAAPALAATVGIWGEDGVESLGWPARELEVEVGVHEVWGTATGVVQRLTPIRRSLQARGQAPGFTGPAAAAAADEFESLLELLLDAASTELLLRRLADALRRTSRQVNTLERRVAPELSGAVRRVRGLLEEREREDHARLKHLMARRGKRATAPD